MLALFAGVAADVAAEPRPPVVPLPQVAAEPGAAPYARLPKLTAAEMLTAAREKLARMSGRIGEIGQRIENARKQQDIILLNCLVDVHLRMKAVLRTAEERVSRLRDSAAAADVGETSHLYSSILLLDQKIDLLADEATSCAGNIETVNGAIVEMESPPDTTGEDVTEPAPIDRTFGRPPVASPVR